MSNLNDFSGKFEKLAEVVVWYLLKNSNQLNRKDFHIKRTRENKDGGYDVKADISYGGKEYTVYFECKLRGKNLGLRDIAANVIIAFNEGAVSFVAFTNNRQTAQADKHVYDFMEKTHLQIRIVTGDELKKYCCSKRLPLPSEIYKNINSVKSRELEHDQVLCLNLSGENILSQIIPDKRKKIGSSKIPFVVKTYP